MEIKRIFDDVQLQKAAFILENKHAKLLRPTSTEIKNLAVVCCPI